MQIEPPALLAEAQEMALLIRMYEKHIAEQDKELEQLKAALERRVEPVARPVPGKTRKWRRIFRHT